MDASCDLAVEYGDDVRCKTQDVPGHGLAFGRRKGGIHGVFTVKVHLRHQMEFCFADGSPGDAGHLDLSQVGILLHERDVDAEIMLLEVLGVGGFPVERDQLDHGDPDGAMAVNDQAFVRKYSDPPREKQTVTRRRLQRLHGESADFFVIFRMSEHEVHEAFIRSGSRFDHAAFDAALREWLEGSPDPAMALKNLLRFVGSTVSAASLFNDLLQYPLFGSLLLRVFGSSQYFADVIVREPGLFRWLTASDVMTSPVTAVYLHAEIERIIATFTKPEKRLDAMKRLHRRELLRIGAQDLFGHADLAAATLQLSVLADAVIAGALRVAQEQVGERNPSLRNIPFCVVGLGKLGGNELNYSSDIDVMFVYEADAEGTKGQSAHEYFNRLAERLVRNLSTATAEGHLYRVDTRLRPESGAGPLAMAAGTMLTYYESRGELWERQMLIKARPVAGAMEFGERFIGQLEPFVYPRTSFDHPGASVARIKARIEAVIGDVANVKLMAGGIRDIEFIVQTLQLLNGGRTRAVRERGTLAAIGKLRDHGLLSPGEAAELTSAYTLYRTIEHRLQTMLNTQTHTLPDQDGAFHALARRSGLDSGAALRAALDEHLMAVRSIFTQVLAVPKESRPPPLSALAEGGMDEEAAAALLVAQGFREGRRAARNVRTLTAGSARQGTREFDTRTRDAFRSVAAPLFEELLRTPDPDTTLAALTAVASSQPDSHVLYRQLADTRFRRFLIDICAAGPRFARGLARDPLLLETLASDPDALGGAVAMPLPSSRDLAAFKFQQELRSGIRYQLGFSGFDQLTGELSSIASFIVTTLTARTIRDGRRRVPLALFALGKFGTEELGYDADLDLMFVAGTPGDGSAGETAEKAAEAIVRSLSAVAAEGHLYDVDVRLRPEGRSAPLVVEAGAYAKYLAGRASLWERQSLTRLRFVAGDPAVGHYVTALAARHVYDDPLPRGWTGEVVTMRRKMETRSRTRAAGFLDIKLGPGGMADCEFIAQMIQMKFGGAHPALRGLPTVPVLRSPVHGALPADKSDHCASAYGMFRRLELLLRTGLEDKGSILPEGEALDLLARLYDGSTGAALASRVAAAMKRVRTTFLDVAGRLA